MKKHQQNIDPLDSDNIVIYRDAEYEPCEIYMSGDKAWKNRVIDATKIYNTNSVIDFES